MSDTLLITEDHHANGFYVSRMSRQNMVVTDPTLYKTKNKALETLRKAGQTDGTWTSITTESSVHDLDLVFVKRGSCWSVERIRSFFQTREMFCLRFCLKS